MRLSLVLLAVCAACAERPTPCQLKPTPSGEPAAPIGLVGAPLSATFASPFGLCNSSAPFDARTASVEVRDPAGKLVAARVSEVFADLQDGFSTANVVLTPTMAGRHSVLVSFEPGLGVVRAALYVAVDRRAEQGVEESFPEDVSTCTSLQRTSRGAVVCERSGEVVVFRRGAREQSFPGVDVVVVGDVAWSQYGTRVERRVDEGTLMVAESLLVDGLVAGSAGEHTAGRSLRAVSTERGWGVAEVSWSGVLAARDHLAWGRPLDEPRTFALDEGEAWMLTNHGLCNLTLQSCTDVGLARGNATSQGVTPTVGWWARPTPGGAVWLEWMQRPFRAGATNFVAVRAPLQGSFLRDGDTGAFLPVFADGDVRFERWPDGRVVTVTDEWVALLDTPRRARFFRR